MADLQPTLPPFPVQEGVRFAHLPGHHGYAVSDDGRVLSCLFGSRIGPWRELRVNTKRTGHQRVALGRERRTLYVHQAVLMAFVGPCPDGMEACHFPDRDPTNCRLENLRWDTRSSNQLDRREHGTSFAGSKSPQAKLQEADILEIRARRNAGESCRKIAKAFGVSHGLISKIVRGVDWSHVQE